MDSEWEEKEGINDLIKLNYAAPLMLSDHLAGVAKYILQLPVCRKRAFRMQLCGFPDTRTQTVCFQLLR